jgi:hypothetical protein
LAGARIPVFLLDLASGKRELWREFRADPAGLLPENTAIVLTRDGKSWFTSYQHILGELYLAEGLR